VHGDIRGTAVSGSSPGSPRALDRGDIATGGGADGEGELVPPPLSLTLPRSHISSPPHPSRAFGAPPPPPSGGVGSAWRYQGNSRIRLFSRISPCAGPWGYRHGGWGRRGGGTRSPSPVSNAPEIPHIFSAPPHPRLRQKIPVHFCRHPHPTRAFGAPPPPPSGGRGQCMAISGEQPYPALLQDLPVHWTVGISPRGVGPTGRGNSFPLPCL